MKAPYEYPERLSEEERAAVLRWVKRRHPQLVEQLPDIEEEMLDNYRAKGRRPCADWAAGMRGWIRKGIGFGDYPSRPYLAPYHKLSESAPAEVIDLAERAGRKL